MRATHRIIHRPSKNRNLLGKPSATRRFSETNEKRPIQLKMWAGEAVDLVEVVALVIPVVLISLQRILELLLIDSQRFEPMVES